MSDTLLIKAFESVIINGKLRVKYKNHRKRFEGQNFFLLLFLLKLFSLLFFIIFTIIVFISRLPLLFLFRPKIK